MPQFNPAPFRRFVRQQATPYTIRRPVESGTLDVTGSEDIDMSEDVAEATYGTEQRYAELTEPRRILIIGTSESMQPTMAGERQSSMVIAYTTPDTDLREDDVFDSNGTTFEVVASHGVPDEENAILTRHEIDNP